MAVLLSTITACYLLWFAVWHERALSNPNSPYIPEHTLLDWEWGLDAVVVTDTAQFLIVDWYCIARCKICAKYHPARLDCWGDSISPWLEATSLERQYGPIAYSSYVNDRLSYGTLAFPPWLPIPILAAFPVLYAAFIFRRRRRRRRRPGHCLKCDYDLTGNMSGVCPECGMEIRQ